MVNYEERDFTWFGILDSTFTVIKFPDLFPNS